ncbi:MAG: hypothetical protein HY540_01200 [Deltaproteobacteria bacterium]|nr:hypothetical protein [Deltaproteobacteria bacterium]
MNIRRAIPNDFDAMVLVDQRAYGNDGASRAFFEAKFAAFPEGMLVVEESDRVIGFFVFEMRNGEDVGNDFTALNINTPLRGRWMHAIAFTPPTHYQKKEVDDLLLKAGEEIAKQFGCRAACVPLPQEHPHAPQVFQFWQSNGYKNVGTIDWISPDGLKVACDFYRKNFSSFLTRSTYNPHTKTGGTVL